MVDADCMQIQLFITSFLSVETTRFKDPAPSTKDFPTNPLAGYGQRVKRGGGMRQHPQSDHDGPRVNASTTISDCCVVSFWVWVALMGATPLLASPDAWLSAGRGAAAAI